ncbi:glycosyl hydrolase 53 family protein [Paenibacillus tundrae]|uniref:Arabinogalactan endo-beta-1,4-galactanase n=1 Tax=Paenibacillus tundrae TaxID=528187 RepID=A0ABT9WDJ6_9BACL|nr:glycosyl hydrolase 53 family protein [Paenibacillus tundrae]MDQ0171326.1 arabinogalactan endo-1,4-beta-galactosidase [Paenibacillus tundrae]
MKKFMAKISAVTLIVALFFSLFQPNSIHAETEDRTFAYGADISILPLLEAQGDKFFYKDGTEGDLIDILQEEFGINAVRIRTWVNPNDVDRYADQEGSIALAKRAHAKGMEIMIDFHYGDTWNSVGGQVAPVAWQGLSYEDMKTTLYDYTFNYMTALTNEGIIPKWVQIGNETNSGIVGWQGSLRNPVQMVGLFNAGYDAVKAVSPSSVAMIHLAGPQRDLESFLDPFFNNGGKTDLIGFSSYAGVNDIQFVGERAEYLHNKYNKPVMMAEVGGRWDRGTQTKRAIDSWINLMKRIGGNDSGVFYWAPETLPPGPEGGYDMGARDTNGQWTPAMDAFRDASGAGREIKRIESYNFPGRFLRHANFQARIDQNVSPLDDSKFKIVPGLAGGGTISFESTNFPGYYLKHSNYQLVLVESDGTTAFNRDASFMRVPGLADPALASYQSYNVPDRYVRHSNYQLRIDSINDTTSKADATFREVQ